MYQTTATRRALAAAIASGIAITSLSIVASSHPAAADPVTLDQQIYNTAGEGLWLHPDAPGLATATSVLMPDGTGFSITCFVTSDDVAGDAVWDYGTDDSTGDTGYAADKYIDTPVTENQEATQLEDLGLTQCGDQSSAGSPDVQPSNTSASTDATTFYDRQAAVAWAEANVDHAPLIQNEGDCSWFASQALWAGGLPQTDDWQQDSSNGILGNDTEAMIKALVHGGYSPTDPINPTLTATNANDLVSYLVTNGLATEEPITWSDNTADGAQPGDLIAYDWDHGSDGTIDHVAMVTAYAPDTNYPLVTQHSPDQDHRYWSWSELDNSWIQYGPDYQPQQGSTNGPPTAFLIHITY